METQIEKSTTTVTKTSHTITIDAIREILRLPEGTSLSAISVSPHNSCREGIDYDSEYNTPAEVRSLTFSYITITELAEETDA